MGILPAAVGGGMAIVDKLAIGRIGPLPRIAASGPAFGGASETVPIDSGKPDGGDELPPIPRDGGRPDITKGVSKFKQLEFCFKFLKHGRKLQRRRIGVLQNLTF